MKRAYAIVLLVLAITVLKGQTTGGKVVTTSIPSPSLKNNIIDYSDTRRIAVYLPQSYSAAGSEARYPVVYFLGGWGDNIDMYINGDYQGFKLKSSMDNLISSKAIKEMIFVLLDGQNLFNGSFYENSSVTGNWRDWIVKDVVSYVDNNYRTIRNRDSRAICGHSMGGFGAVNAGMKNPDTFGVVYALSPGLYDQNGLKDQGQFAGETAIKTFIAKAEEWKNMERTKAISEYKSYVQTQMNNNWFTGFIYGYGSAFSPDSAANPPFIKYPYRLENSILKCDSTILKNYESGFGGLASEVIKYKSNFISLNDLTIEYGTQDEYQWICNGCKYMAQLLNAQGISNRLITFVGGHQDRLRSRIEENMLPRVSSRLKFEDPSPVNEYKSGMPDNFKLFQNYPNPFNPGTKIKYQLSASGHVLLKVFDILGRDIKVLVNEFKPAGNYNSEFNTADTYNVLSSGIYYYSLKVTFTENQTTGTYSKTKKMIYLR